jgi:YVTN family beta-propeller protein
MAASTLGYSLQTTISLPGGVGGHGDWVAYDPDTKTVWLAQSPDNNVVVIDTTTNTIKATIPNIGNGNGLAFSSQYAFVADVTNNQTDVIDKRTFQVVARVAQTGTTPDSVSYISSTNQVAVASDDKNVEDFLNATAPFAQTSSLQLTPNPAVTGPDVSLYVPSKDLLYQPVDKQMDVINPHTGAIVATWNLVTTGSVKPAVYDPVTNHFLVGTTNNQMLVVDGNNGTVLSTIAIPGSVDETAIDVSARLAYVGDKSGVVDLINLDTNQLAGQLPAEVNMHTLTVDPTTHDVYVYENGRNTVDVYAPTPITTDTLYRFFDTKDGSHFFTSSASEKNTILATRSDLVQEANGFGAVDPSSNDPNATAVFRFFDTGNGTHFFTTSATERDSVIASRPDLKLEGTAFNADTSQLAGDRAVYRFFDSSNGTHFYTADPGERASILANQAQLKDEGIAFYAPSTVQQT